MRHGSPDPGIATITALLYTKQGIDWRSEHEWRDGLAKLAGNITTTDRDCAAFTGPLMARDYVDENGDAHPGNPDLQGKILIEVINSKGETSWSLSSTRRTRDAAYQYLLEKSGIAIPKRDAEIRAPQQSQGTALVPFPSSGALASGRRHAHGITGPARHGLDDVRCPSAGIEVPG